MSVKVPLTQGEFAIVDDCDAEEILSHKWCVLIKRTGAMYATRSENGKGILMHRAILGVTDRSVDVDHINRNGLDNRRKNLRECSRSQNMANKKKQPGKSSKFNGVNRSKGEKAGQ